MAAITASAAVMMAFFLKDHYPDFMKEMTDAGYPLQPFVALSAGAITHLVTWWTSADLVALVFIQPIKSWKRIVNAWKSPN